MLNIKLFIQSITLSLLLFFILSGESKSSESAKFTLATYNVKNLFDGIQNPDKKPGEKAKPKYELKALGDAIRKIDADVLALQEVESESTLKQFRDYYLKDLGYNHLVLKEANDSRGIDVAVLSRFQVMNVKSHKDLKFDVPGVEYQESFSRDLLQVKIKVNKNYIFTLFVAHLKSHWGGKVADAKRKAEAQQITHILRSFQRQNPDANFVLVGDFNDTPDKSTIQSLLKPTSDFSLYDCMSDELGADIYTYHPEKYRSRIDYILLSQTMKREYVQNSVKIHQDPARVFKKASDHLPVTVQFNVAKDK